MPGEAADSRLIKQTRHELSMLPYYGVFDDIAFKVDGGTVTLLGAVTRPKHESPRAVIVDDERRAVRQNPVGQRLGFLPRKWLGPAESDAEHGIRVECV